MKKCPYCAEEIQDDAIKCKHCSSGLRGDSKAIIKPDEKPNEILGLFMLFIPLGASFLSWFWIGGMNLLEGPGSKLNMLIALTILSTAVLAAIEANKLGMGQPNDVNKKGKKNSSPVSWFFGILLLWIVGYPVYLWTRSKYGLKNYLVPGIIITLIFIISAITMTVSINSTITEVQRSIGGLVSNLQQETSSVSLAPAVTNSLIGKWELMSNDAAMGEKFNSIEIHKDGKVICYNNGEVIFEGKYTLKGDSWIKFELSEEQKQKSGVLTERKPQTPEEAQEAAVAARLGVSVNPMGDLIKSFTVGYLFDGKPKQFILSFEGNDLTIMGENYPTVVYGETINSTITWGFAKKSSSPTIVSTSPKAGVSQKITNNELAAQANLKSIVAACFMYQTDNNEFPSSLSVLFGQYLPPDFSSTQREGYEFVYERSIEGNSFKCTAKPIQRGITGNKVFLITDAGNVSEIE